MSRYRLGEHQRYALEVMATNPHLGIFYQMGCGKTMVILEWVRNALKQGMIKDVLVVCPASLVPSWQQAITDLVKFEGFDSHNIKQIRDAMTITSYQKTWTSVKIPVVKGDRHTFKKELRLRENLDKQWGCVVIDESHSIGNHSSNQTRAAVTLGQLARYRFALSGTPVHGGGGREDFSKLYGQIQFLTGGKAFKNWTAFCKEYVQSFDMWRNPRTYDVQKCRRLLQNHGIVCRLEDCFDMPGKIEQIISCPLEEKKAYEDIRKGNLEPYGIDIENAGGQYIKLLQVCSGSMKINQNDEDTLKFKSSKDDVLKDILEGTDEPVVIYCNFRASVDRCAAIGKKAGRSVVVFDGRSKDDSVWMKFTEGRANLLVVQFQRGAEGLNLQNAHMMVYFEPTTSALKFEQASGRIYRPGQNKKCIYYYLTTPKTIESKVFETVKNGVDVTEDMMRRWSEGEVF